MNESNRLRRPQAASGAQYDRKPSDLALGTLSASSVHGVHGPKCASMSARAIACTSRVGVSSSICCGGEKASQRRDIKRAKQMLKLLPKE